ncbi:uncharacterized protein [Maniola hyperantus]|uniref:uncharacterized protein n=1 Tax=Aphantopus hyperantus TaxID=2795564 RepID=UPI00374A893F
MAGAAALGGLGGSLEDKDCDLLCPVCFELIDEAYVTRCGHSFCYACIAKSVELHRRCPKCGAALAGRDHYFPNFLLNELVARRRLRARPPAGAAAAEPGDAERLRALLAAEARHLALPDVEGMLDVLTRRKRLLEAESAHAHHRLLYEFLAQLLRHRTHQLEQLTREAALVKKDMEHVGGVLRELRAGAAELGRLPSPTEHGSPDPVRDVRPRLGELGETQPRSPPNEEEESFAGGAGGAAGGAGDALAARWRRLAAHFDDFVQCYFAHRADELYFPASGAPTPAPPCLSPVPCAAPAPPAGGGGGAADADPVPQQSTASDTRASSAAGDQRAPESDSSPQLPVSAEPVAGPGSADDVACGSSERYGGLEAFRADLAAFTRYRALRPLATLSYCSDAINYSTIVSTIEFDKDDEFFAIAGVTKRIKVFEFGAVVRDAVDVHYPCAEMQCAHKISCVSWNNYHKHVLASSDYEGTVSVWDVGAAVRTRALQEHDKRAWSVHFNRADVRLLASGGDDARVKLWALNQERSVATLEAKVCYTITYRSTTSARGRCTSTARTCACWRRAATTRASSCGRSTRSAPWPRSRRRYATLSPTGARQARVVGALQPRGRAPAGVGRRRRARQAVGAQPGALRGHARGEGMLHYHLQEHDKRAWSVHFNRADVRLLASGGDDARVKLWALNQERSVATLEAKVCYTITYRSTTSARGRCTSTARTCACWRRAATTRASSCGRSTRSAPWPRSRRRYATLSPTGARQARVVGALQPRGRAPAGVGRRRRARQAVGAQPGALRGHARGEGMLHYHLQEHDKRAWSVHFNRADVRLLASGGDDARVKLWALNQERSVATLEAKVCYTITYRSTTSARGRCTSTARTCACWRRAATTRASSCGRSTRSAPWPRSRRRYATLSPTGARQARVVGALQPRGRAPAGVGRRRRARQAVGAQPGALRGHARGEGMLHYHLQEHDKRAWSVHFNRADVRLLASGGDDARVKLWALNQERSVATLEAKVCYTITYRSTTSARGRCTSTARTCACWRRAATTRASSCGRSTRSAPWPRSRRRYATLSPTGARQARVVGALQPRGRAPAGVGRRRRARQAVGAQPGALRGHARGEGMLHYHLQEHDKRAWSVHFNRADVRLLASGGDDARVKLWALNQERSVATLEAKFNVCCVRFNPRSSAHLAFGSADHAVHYYDLRAPRAPLAVFRDHRKAVSYVQFLDAHTLVSASTDSQLKLWRVESPRCVRSFSGHANEKNFVGLATDGRYVACGSENNALYVYYSGLSRPLLAHRFDAVRGFLERERKDEEPPEFVSAVCWRRAQDRPALLAANSQGTIKVLELV